MAHLPQENTPEPTAELPNPDLNPLINPTLGRNLGRWAEVYFTSPPEKREEAVGELLRELSSAPTSTEPTKETQQIPATSHRPAETQSMGIEGGGTLTTAVPALVQCAECGHRHATHQRFCGMCGAPLPADPSSPEPYQFDDAVVHDVPRPHEFVFAQGPIFGTLAPSGTPEPRLNDPSDIRWLREKSFAGADSPGRGRRLVPAALALVAIGVLIYAQSRPQPAQPKPNAAATTTQKPEAPQAPTTPTTTAPSAAASASSQAQPSVPPQDQTSADPNKQTTAANTTAPQPATQPPAAPQTAPQPPVTRGTSDAAGNARTAEPAANAAQPVPPATGTDADSTSSNGAQELALAEDYLSGKRGPRDSAEAAKFLWKAVGKENPSAILLLSDMYLVGDGVPKSCDQARLLLTAAVRKNVPQAAQKLHNLLNSGCR